MTPSKTDQTEHVYELEPVETVRITVPESRLIATRFLPGEIVKKGSILYKVLEIKFVKDNEGKVVLRYVVRDELSTQREFDDSEVEKGDQQAWFPMQDRESGRQ